MKKQNKKRWSEEFYLRKDIMKKEFIVDMTEEEMLRFYANKIVEDGIRDCLEFNAIIPLSQYNTNEIKLENYKDEILQLLYKDERIADVVIDDELNVDMVFYTDFCPFYYEDNADMEYNDFLKSPSIQGVMLEKFIDYIQSCILEESYISTRILINDFIEKEQVSGKKEEILSNFLKKSIIETGFVDKYIDNINVYVTHKNYKELEEGLSKIVKQKEKEAKKQFKEAIKEMEEEFD